MAGFRTHVTVSTMLGLGYGAAARPVGFDADACVLAAGLTGVGGMLPDLDSGPGRPVRELASLSAAVLPLMLLPRFHHAGASQETTLACLAGLYFALRYGVRAVLKRVAVHRGMFHSLPAMLIAGLLVYVEYGSPNHGIRLLLAVGVMLGFLSHLVLDELYSVDFDGVRLKLNKSAGSAVKFASPSWVGTAVCYGLLLGASAAAWGDYRDNPQLDWGPLGAPAAQPPPPAPPRGRPLLDRLRSRPTAAR